MSALANRIVGIYRRHAAAFDRDRGRDLVERAWLDLFVETMPAGRRVLDLGCGMGQPIAQYLVERDCGVTGIDTSSPLLQLARQRLPDQRWIEADMRGLDLGERFDGILAYDSFFHLTPEDQRGMFPVFAAHAAPGAALLFTSGPAHGEALGSFEGETLYHASLDPEEYRNLLADNGFAVLRHGVEDPECGGHTLWLAKRRAASE